MMKPDKSDLKMLKKAHAMIMEGCTILETYSDSHGLAAMDRDNVIDEAREIRRKSLFVNAYICLSWRET